MRNNGLYLSIIVFLWCITTIVLAISVVGIIILGMMGEQWYNIPHKCIEKL